MLNIGVSKLAWYADRVRVPNEALSLRLSAPPKMLRARPSMYAEPSALPTSVPVLNLNRDFSITERYTSMSVGVVEGSV